MKTVMFVAYCKTGVHFLHLNKTQGFPASCHLIEFFPVGCDDSLIPEEGFLTAAA